MGMYGWHDNSLKAFDLEVDGTLTFGDAATDNLIIKGRVSSMTAAGSAVQIASAYTHGEGIEMRYQVTNWTGVGDSFKGMYLRSEAITNSAADKSIYGAEIYGVCNNVTMDSGSLWGALFYSYVKGVDAVTIKNMYAVQGELSWDASRTGDCTITTAAACFRAKITGGQVADYTKIHGYELTIGEMDGDSAKFGKGLFMQDDSETGGTCTLTTGIDIAIGCTTGISISGTCSAAGILLGTTNKLSFHDSGIYMRASADGHFEIVSDDTITLSAPGHGGIVFGGETDWGVSGTAGHQIDGTGWDWVTQTVGYVSSGALAAACAAAYNCLVVTAATHSTASSFFGTWTELYVSASDVLTNAANFAAVWGQVELGATVTSTDSEDFMAAVYGNFKTGTSFTNNTKVCGFLAQSEVATGSLTNNGTISAFYAMKKSGCQVWDHGLYIADDAATTGISIGTSTTGISIGNCVVGTTIGTFSSPVTCQNTDYVASGSAYSITKSMISGVVEEEIGAGYAIRQLWSRLKVTADQDGGKDAHFYGACLQTRLHTGAAAVAIDDGTYAGTWNYLENSDSGHDLTIGGGYFYGSRNMVELISSANVNGGTFAAAEFTNHVDCSMTSATKFDAIFIDKISGATDWKIGVDINDSTTGIQIGDATTGIQLDGTFTGNAIAVTQDALTVGDSYSGVRVAVTAAAPNNAYGMAAYFDTTVTGTQADNIYNTGSWINMGAGFTCGANKLVVAFEGGIYDGGASLSTAWFVGMQLQMITASAPSLSYWFRFNYNDGAAGSTTAIFAAANPGSAAFTSGAGVSSTKNGDIAIADIVGTGVVYVRTYNAAG